MANLKNKIMVDHNIDVDELKYSEDFADAAYKIAYADGLQFEQDLKEKIQFLFEQFKSKWK